MKTVEYDIIIDKVSDSFGNYTGTVEVHHHIEGGNLGHGERDGFETTRVPLTIECINADGTMNDDEIYKVVLAAVGETSVVELESEDLKLTFTPVDCGMIGDFEPCEGRWGQDVERSSDFDLQEVIEEMERKIEEHTLIKVTVQLFHANGHAITGDNPGHGTFIATRKSK